MAVGIERPQTDSEKGDYLKLGTQTPRQKFLKALSVVEQRFTKEHKPFDGQCAKADFNEELEALERECERIHGYIIPAFVEQIKFGDLERYGDTKLFDVVREDEEVEPVNINGIRSSVKTGFTVQYKCKRRGHGCSVFMDTATYEERFKNKKKEDTDKSK